MSNQLPAKGLQCGSPTQLHILRITCFRLLLRLLRLRLRLRLRDIRLTGGDPGLLYGIVTSTSMLLPPLSHGVGGGGFTLTLILLKRPLLSCDVVTLVFAFTSERTRTFVS
jgi:hypothetical protein